MDNENIETKDQAVAKADAKRKPISADEARVLDMGRCIVRKINQALAHSPHPSPNEAELRKAIDEEVKGALGTIITPQLMARLKANQYRPILNELEACASDDQPKMKAVQ